MRRAVELLGIPLRVNAVDGPGDARFEPGTVDVVAASDLPADLPYGEVDPRGGGAAYEYVRRAVELALADEVHAVATAPLNKEAMHRAGHRYPGHTGLLGELPGQAGLGVIPGPRGVRVIHVSTHV